MEVKEPATFELASASSQTKIQEKNYLR